MINLRNHKHKLVLIINMLHNVFDIEAAIFNYEADLVDCSEDYSIHRDLAVDMSTVRKALKTGDSFVNEPGKMDACLRCRFKGSCLSTVEIISCIKYNGLFVGVLALKAFSKENHDKVVASIEFYISLMDSLSHLVATLIVQGDHNQGGLASNAFLLTTFDMLEDGFISTDIEGNVEDINSSALKLFSTCDMMAKSIFQLLPDSLVSLILNGKSVSDYRTKISNTPVRINSLPVKNRDTAIGNIIRISGEKNFDNFNSYDFGLKDKVCSSEIIIGKGTHVVNLKKKIAKIADSPSTVFITGETGTGKSLLAKAIHGEGERAKKPFVLVNCTGIPESLFESELFGYEAGAFTGAKKEGKPGKFELASNGTIFLDEISEIPINVQAKLLCVLREGTFERVGGTTSINANVRVIAASNHDLHKLIEEKKFRADLFYRLNVIPVELIPLRERKEDIVLLANSFLERYCKKLKKAPCFFDEGVIKIFNDFQWPGNIRQLENVVEYCVNMVEYNLITPSDLPGDLIKEIEKSGYMEEYNLKSNVLKENEVAVIVETIDKYGWDVKGKTQAAKELGINLRTLYRKIEHAER